MTQHARGEFDVKITPQAQDEAEDSTLGRMSLDKQFHGDLQARSKGEMLTVAAPIGSAVYVAIERVAGSLEGRSGSFALVHQGIATSKGQELTIFVAPDSGSAELTGLSGKMTINITNGKHLYDLEYTLEQ